MNEQRRRWFESLFSTDPADHELAESGIRDFFRAAEQEPPPLIAWLDSPAEASYAALALCAQHNPLLGRIASSLEQVPTQRAELARAREKVSQSIGASDWSMVASVVGVPLAGMGAPPRDDLQGKITLTRISYWQDPSAAMGKISQDDLFQAETQFWRVIAEAMATLGNMLQSSVTRKYHLAWMAMDEAAAEGGMTPPPLLTAAWQVARSAGPWWPFRNAALISERPVELHRHAEWFLERGDGPAIRYRDGWHAFAWNGQSMPRKWIEQPESISPRQLKQADRRFQVYISDRFDSEVRSSTSSAAKPSAIFSAKLPSDIAARIEYFRKYAGGRLPFYERYLAGDRQNVWKDLIGLKRAVRTDPYAADALAVANETMRRVRENVLILIGRLQEIGYRFSTQQSKWEEQKRGIDFTLAINVPVSQEGLRSPHVQGALEMLENAKQMLRQRLDSIEKVERDTNVRAHVPPAKDIAKQIRKLQSKLGTLPLSLKVFYEVVGSVDLMGQHSNLTPPGGSVCPDPLVIFSVEDARANAEQLEGDEEEGGYVVIAPDEIHKAGESGGEPYEIAVPDEGADGELLNERHGLFFVDYLRMAFRHGGFPGYEGYDRDVPREIEQLGKDLLAF